MVKGGYLIKIPVVVISWYTLYKFSTITIFSALTVPSMHVLHCNTKYRSLK